MMPSLSLALCLLAGPPPDWAPISDLAAETVSNENEFPPGEDEFPEGEDELPEGEDELPEGEDELPEGEDELPEGEDGAPNAPSESSAQTMPEGEDAAVSPEGAMPAGEDTADPGSDLPPLAPVEALCVAPLRARGIIKITSEKRQSIDLSEAEVEGNAVFAHRQQTTSELQPEDGCLARTQLLVRLNERCELRMDLVEQSRQHLQASSIRLLGSGCPDVELPSDRFLMSRGAIHFELSGSLTEGCVDQARLQGSGSTQLRTSTGETIDLEFVDFAIEGDLLGQWDPGLSCARRGRPLALGLDQSQANKPTPLWKPIGIATGILLVGGGAMLYYTRIPEPTTRMVIDLR